ncbi:hypothetical protein [Mycobacteroides salmoniphilum]|uniref:SCO6045-like C-terminal domain-containing protein n=1 Tax=Mycobacteroides salmoniphilum TaxID=404941 RepID=A0A4R8S938_9MYCO|nr:hypothetical protein [Mycobacteroides salmoniphilum]TDZ90118.1 hypothetical protein CCUG60885_04764 [Mycobacteroides salmoniphilum]TEA00084.1 hypothetical protein CCUG60883_04767 [Mycobacteroides salmoniphilum]
MLDNREMLRRRQLSVLSDLLAGNAPSGFDEYTALTAGAQLRTKRRVDMATAVPWLAETPNWEYEFEQYALLHSMRCCVLCDAKEFRGYAYELPRLRDWIMDREVAEGLRRIALVRRGGRRELQIAFGKKLRYFALRPERAEA